MLPWRRAPDDVQCCQHHQQRVSHESCFEPAGAA